MLSQVGGNACGTLLRELEVMLLCASAVCVAGYVDSVFGVNREELGKGVKIRE